MLRAATLAIVVLGIGVPTASGAKGHRRHIPQCPPPHAEILEADSRAILYTTGAHSEYARMAACAHGFPHPFVLAECEELDCEGPWPEREVLAGAVIAYELSSSGVDKYGIKVGTARRVIVLANVVTGLILNKTVPPANTGSLTALVATPAGAAAWITGVASGEQVWTMDRLGVHLIAEGPGIAPHSLAINETELLSLPATTLYWLNEGLPQTAVLE